MISALLVLEQDGTLPPYGDVGSRVVFKKSMIMLNIFLSFDWPTGISNQTILLMANKSPTKLLA